MNEYELNQLIFYLCQTYHDYLTIKNEELKKLMRKSFIEKKEDLINLLTEKNG